MSAVDGGPYREVREPDAAQLCPICAHERLEPVAIADAELPSCAACGGVFVPVPLMARVTDARDPIAIALLDEPRARVSGDTHRRLACPRCRATMGERPVAPGAAVLIDECTAHGVWFDRGELREVASFVASGGFLRGELAAAAARARAQAGQKSPPYRPPPPQESRWAPGLFDRPLNRYLVRLGAAYDAWRIVREAAQREDAARQAELRRARTEQLAIYERAHPVRGRVVRALRFLRIVPL
ncbi:MAG: zf-TFIIB domain-containing protein [Deltaproteobacteria bacterium]|nr:zf-TFIIB domain-containing protein [Deltaproteobacteria bacterium]